MLHFLTIKFFCIFVFIPKALNGEGGDSLGHGSSPHPASEPTNLLPDHGDHAEPEGRKGTPSENGVASKQEVASGDRLESRWI